MNEETKKRIVAHLTDAHEMVRLDQKLAAITFINRAITEIREYKGIDKDATKGILEAAITSIQDAKRMIDQ
jgi:hypothetical protein